MQQSACPVCGAVNGTCGDTPLVRPVFDMGYREPKPRPTEEIAASRARREAREQHAERRRLRREGR